MIPIHNYIAAKVRLSQSGGNWAVAKSKAVAAAGDHVNYIAYRPGEDLEKGGREFFDNEKGEITPGEVNDWVKDNYPGRNVVVHKLTLAPDINLAYDDEQTYTRHMMQELSGKLGQDLDWKAVAHRNTAHHHLHILISPTDKEGRDVRISKEDCNHLERASDEYISREYPYLWKQVVEPGRQERQWLKEQKLSLEMVPHQVEQERQARQVIPFLTAGRKALMKEVLDPYEQWKRQHAGPEEIEKSKPDTITFAGKKYSFENDLSDLKNLTNEIWEKPPEQWLPKSEYGKLKHWISLKEEGKTLEPELPKYNYLEPSADPDKISYTYMHPLEPVVGEGFTRFEERTIEVTKDSDRFELGELSLAMRYNNLKERHYGELETKLDPEDKAKFDFWLEEKNKLWGLELADTILHETSSPPTAEQLTQDFMDRASGGGGGPGTVSGALIEQDQKPGQERSEAKLLELPFDEMESVKSELEQLTHYKYQDWLAREGSFKDDERRRDDLQIKRIEKTLARLERGQKDRDKREFDERIKEKDDLAFDIDDY